MYNLLNQCLSADLNANSTDHKLGIESLPLLESADIEELSQISMVEESSMSQDSNSEFLNALENSVIVDNSINFQFHSLFTPLSQTLHYDLLCDAHN